MSNDSDMVVIPFRQLPRRVARIKNPVLEIPEEYLDMKSKYDLLCKEDGTIILKKVE